MSDRGYSFTARIDKYDFGKYFYTVVYLPDDVAAQLPFQDHPRLRVEAQIDAFSIDGTFMPDKLGSAQTRHLPASHERAGDRIWYMMVPKKVLKAIGKTLGDEVTVRFNVADQRAVAMPVALEEFLAENPRLHELWNSLTPGRRRSLAHPLCRRNRVKRSRNGWRTSRERCSIGECGAWPDPPPTRVSH